MGEKKYTCSSYSQILWSSFIVGGAQGVNYLIALVRTKVVAILLGPSGIGLISLYASAIELVSAVARLGINESGVREVAAAQSSGDSDRLARTVRTLHRACWVTGFLGWLITSALSYPLSVWVFGSSERMWAFVALGATVFFGSISGGQNALIQGLRRIGDLARLSVLAASVSTLIAVILYAWAGEKAIIPVLIISAAVNLGSTWWFARRIQIAPITITWVETFANSKRLVNLGLAFMYGVVLSAAVMLVIRAFIVRETGVEASGIYQAAWGISGMFGGFILGAMGADFYPRLTAVADHNQQVNQLVNEQIEIGILLALPGLLGTIVFAPWLIHLFYSAKFLQSADLLPWLVVGIYGQMITFPLGFIQRAKGKARWIFISQSHLHLLHLGLAISMFFIYGLIGMAWAFAISTYIHGVLTLLIARHLSQFTWSASTITLAMTSTFLIIAAFVAKAFTNELSQLTIGTLFTIAASAVSLRGLASRLGADHRLINLALKLPGGRFACGLRPRSLATSD